MNKLSCTNTTMDGNFETCRLGRLLFQWCPQWRQFISTVATLNSKIEFVLNQQPMKTQHPRKPRISDAHSRSGRTFLDSSLLYKKERSSNVHPQIAQCLNVSLCIRSKIYSLMSKSLMSYHSCLWPIIFKRFLLPLWSLPLAWMFFSHFGVGHGSRDLIESDSRGSFGMFWHNSGKHFDTFWQKEGHISSYSTITLWLSNYIFDQLTISGKIRVISGHSVIDSGTFWLGSARLLW